MPGDQSEKKTLQCFNSFPSKTFAIKRSFVCVNIEWLTVLNNIVGSKQCRLEFFIIAEMSILIRISKALADGDLDESIEEISAYNYNRNSKSPDRVDKLLMLT